MKDLNEISVTTENLWQIPLDIDRAIIELKKFIADGAAAYGRVQEGTKAFCLALWKQGGIIANLLEQSRYGDKVIPKLERATGYKRDALYDRVKVFRYFGSEAELQVEMERRLEQAGTLSWSTLVNHVEKSLRASNNGAATEDAPKKLEDRKRALERRAEKLEQAAEALQREVASLNGETNEETLGVAEKARQVAQETRMQTKDLALKKPERVTDEAYLAYVRGHACSVCARPPGVVAIEAHHLEKSGMGTKGPDLCTVPLCTEHHQEVERSNEAQWWQHHNVDPWYTAFHLLAHYIDPRIEPLHTP